DHDAPREQRLFELSSAISRRSLPTRLWLIQRSVDHGDVAGALENFDIALRTSTAAPDALFPVLATASSDPGLAQPLARLLDRPRYGRNPFPHSATPGPRGGGGGGGGVLHRRAPPLTPGKRVDKPLGGELKKKGESAGARRVHDAFGTPAGQDL